MLDGLVGLVKRLGAEPQIADQCDRCEAAQGPKRGAFHMSASRRFV